MKKTILYFLAIVMLFWGLTVIENNEVEASTTNLVSNGGFDSDVSEKTNWRFDNLSSNASYEIVGDNYVEFKASSNAYIFQKVNVEAGKEYVLKFRVKGEVGTKGAVKMQVTPDTSSWSGDFTLTTNEWEKKEFTFTIASIDEGTQPLLLLRLFTTTEAKISFSDVSMIDKAAQTELITNGNFTEDVSDKTNWRFDALPSGAAYEVVNETYCAVTSTQNDYIFQKVNVEAGKEYVLKCRVKGEAGTKGAVKMQVTPDTSSWSGDFTLSTDEWEEKEFTFTIASIDEGTQPLLLLRLFTDTEKTLAFDEVTLVEQKNKYDEYTILKNGNFEEDLSYWNEMRQPGGNGVYTIDTEGPGEGEKSLQMKADGIDGLYQTVTLRGNSEFTLSFRAKGEIGTQGLIKVQLGLASDPHIHFTIAEDGWNDYSFTFTSASADKEAQIQLRLHAAGTILYDDVYIDGPLTEEQEIEASGGVVDNFDPTEKHDPVDGVTDVMVNGSYELLDEDGIPVELDTTGGVWGVYANVVESSEAPDGSHYLQIDANNAKANPWVRHTVTDIVPGATYQLTLKYKSTTNKFGVKFEFHGKEGTANTFFDSTQSPYYTVTDEWTEVSYSVTIPILADTLQIYPRNFDSADGTIYVDDLELVMVKRPAAFEQLDTDRIFYYEEVTTGIASVDLNELYDDAEYSVKFELLDGDNVIQYSENVGFENNTASWNYDVQGLEKEKAYTVRSTIWVNGATYQTFEQNIYRFDRPNYITEDGYLIDENGEPFDLQILYHVYDDEGVQKAAAGGVTVIQGMPYSNAEDLEEYLDKMYYEYGVKVAVPLYALSSSLKPAGHPETAEKAIELVHALKDHPGVFCWMVMDEPYAQGYDKVDMAEWLENSYVQIRSVDRNHPIMICECYYSYFSTTEKYADILVIDPYPGSWNDYLTHVGNIGAIAVDTVQDNKPVVNLLQTWEYNGVAPEVGEVRHMMYQSYLTGQKYVGFFPWEFQKGDGVLLGDSVWWDEITSFNQNERALFLEHFTTGKYETFNQYSDDVVMYESWIKDNIAYIALINRTEDPQSVEVNLKNQTMQVTLNGEASVMAGSDTIIPVLDGAVMKLELTGSDCLLIMVDLSKTDDGDDPDTDEPDNEDTPNTNGSGNGDGSDTDESGNNTVQDTTNGTSSVVVPNTGDDNNLIMWISVIVVSGILLCLLIVKRKRI